MQGDFSSKVSTFAKRVGVLEQDMTQTLQQDFQIQTVQTVQSHQKCSSICHRCDQICLVGREIREHCFCCQLSSRSKVTMKPVIANRQRHAASRLALKHSNLSKFFPHRGHHQILVSIMAQEMSLLQLKWSELYQQCFDRLGRCVSPALLLALFQWAALASAASFQQSSQLFLRCEKARGSAWTSYRTLVGSWTPKALTMRMISQPEDIQWYILYVQCQGWTWHVTFVAQNMRTCDVCPTRFNWRSQQARGNLFTSD